MTRNILAGSIDFGIPESEAVHQAEGCLAQDHEADQCRYAGPPYIFENDGPLHHWRDWANWIAVRLSMGEEFSGKPLKLSFAIRAFAVNDPKEKPGPTKVTVEIDEQQVAGGELAFEADGHWHLVETDLPPTDAGYPHTVRLSLDDGVNLFGDGSHYGKSISFVRLYSSEDALEPGTWREKRIVDCVDLGVTQSEKLHKPIGNFLWGNMSPMNTYGGPLRLEGLKDLSHYREAPEVSAIELNVPPEFLGVDMELEVALRCYGHGDPESEPQPTMLHAMSRTRWAFLGEATVPMDGRFHTFRLKIPASVAEEGGFMLRIDDTKNFFTRDEHYGKGIGYIRLDADPASAHTEADLRKIQQKTPPDILLVMCPVWDVNMPPIALGALASYLEGNGVAVEVYDFNIDCFHTVEPEAQKIWEGSHAVNWSSYEYGQSLVDRFDPEIRQAVDRILETGAPMVGFSIATVNAPFSIRVANLIKEKSPETKIVFGGPGVPFFEEGQLSEHWDWLVYGAGERPLLSIVRGEAEGTLGVISKEHPQAYDPGTNRAFHTELDSLPLVHFSHFNMLKYQNPWRLPMLTSRGCINSCKYCFDTVFYGPFSCLSGKRAYEQMRLLYDRHDRRVFEFADLLCNGDLDELKIMCELLAEADLDLRWGSFAVMRPGMTQELMQLLKKAGCKYLHYGFETGSQRMLQMMGRDYTVQDARDSLKNTQEAGIRTRINIMVGFPGESDRTIQETIDFIYENGKYIDVVETVNPVYIMASTELADQTDKYGIEVPDGVPDHWEAGQVTEEKRREWVYRVMEAVKDAGVTCKYSVMRGFTCKSLEKEYPV